MEQSCGMSEDSFIYIRDNSYTGKLMSEISNHIKILYIMFLKNNYTADQIKNDLNGGTFDCACEMCGIWETYTLAVETRNKVIGFINEYGILQEKRIC